MLCFSLAHIAKLSNRLNHIFLNSGFIYNSAFVYIIKIYNAFLTIKFVIRTKLFFPNTKLKNFIECDDSHHFFKKNTDSLSLVQLKILGKKLYCMQVKKLKFHQGCKCASAVNSKKRQQRFNNFVNILFSKICKPVIITRCSSHFDLFFFAVNF